MSQKTLHTGIAVTVAVLVVGIFFILGVPFSTNSLDTASVGQTQPAAASQVAAQDLVQGSGRAAQPGDTVVVNYTGKLQSGVVFDTSVGKQPYSFTLGAGEVIGGWDQGLVGAQPGTRRLLVVPPALGYGAMDYGPIPGNSTLIFEVEVVSVVAGSTTQ